MSLFKRLFGRKKRNIEREQLIEEEIAPVELKNQQDSESYVYNLCEQMIDVSREMEDIRQEYKKVSSYLADIQVVEGLEGEQKAQLVDVATNLSKLIKARNDYINAEQKISDETFNLMQENEAEIPKLVRRLMDNEKDLDTINRDLKRLAAEKVEWSVLREDCQEEQESLKRLSKLTFGVFGISAVIIAVLSVSLEWGTLPIFIVAFLATLVAAYIVIRMQECAKDIRKCDVNQNHAIALENRIKLKYVNIKNAVDYTCNRFKVKNSRELTYNYEQYNEICREREKFEQINTDMEYFNNRLIRIMRNLNLYDPKIWVNYANAIVNPRDMVELKHTYFSRRQELRNQIDYNLRAIQDMKDEIELYCSFMGDKSEKIRAIMAKVDELNKGLLQ